MQRTVQHFLTWLFPGRMVTRRCTDCACAFRTKARYSGKWGRLCPSCLHWYI